MGDDLYLSLWLFIIFLSSPFLSVFFTSDDDAWCYVGFPTSCYCALGVVSWVLLAIQSCGSGWQEQCAWPCRPQMFQHVISLSPPSSYSLYAQQQHYPSSPMLPQSADACIFGPGLIQYTPLYVYRSLCSIWTAAALDLQGPPFPYFCHRYTDAPIRCTIVSIVVKSI